MTVESIQILHRDGRTENVASAQAAGGVVGGGSQVQIQHPHLVRGGAPAMIPALAPAVAPPVAPVIEEGPPFIVYVDPDLFGDVAADVARWLTLAGAGIFAVGTGKTAWPATLTPDQAALRNLFRRIAALRASCRGDKKSAEALVTLARPPTDRPPPRKARPRASEPTPPPTPPQAPTTKKGKR